MKQIIFTCILTIVGLFFISSCVSDQEESRPNILLIVVDDMGYSDILPFGGEIRTPNLESLASEGMIFTDFHTAATCSPTRSMLMSGTDNHLAGMGSMGEAIAPNQVGKPGYEGYLNDRVVTFATLLQDAGYFTSISGKWHLGEEEEHDPYNRGFNKSFTMLQGGASHFDDEWMMYANYTPVYREDGVRVHVPGDFYSTEFYTDKIIEYIDEREKNQPFFAYLSFTAVLDPLHVPDEFLEKYKGRYDVGYDVLRQERLEKMKEIGIIPKETQPFPRLPMIPAWEDLTQEQKRVDAKRMEIYASMVENIDFHLGRLFQHLKKSDVYQNTIIYFFSDNGANGADMHMYPGTNEDWVIRNSDNRFENMGSQYSRIAQGMAWAQVSMTPFRLFKALPAEGGIRSPLIVRTPDMANVGSRSNAFTHVMDIAPTILDQAGVEHPGTSYKGQKIHPLLGRSMMNVLNGKSESVYDKDTPVCWELFGFKAVRKGDLKLLWLPEPLGIDDWQLYDLSKDPGELNDLSQQLPEIRSDMIEIWNQYAVETGVILPPGGSLRPMEPSVQAD
jgi:arylsulfatase A-like enzyme